MSRIATSPLVLGYFQRRVDMDRAARVANQERLRALRASNGHEVTIFNSHDPVDYEHCRCGGWIQRSTPTDARAVAARG
jgi:hypothetical protein